MRAGSVRDGAFGLPGGLTRPSPSGYRVSVSGQGSRDVLSAVARMEASVAAGGQVVDDSSAPGSWIPADRSGNKVCIAAWPDGAPTANDELRDTAS